MLFMTLLLIAALMIGIGIYAKNRETPMFFFAGIEVKEEYIKDVKAYNKGNAIMWIGYGIGYIILAILSLFFNDLIGILTLIYAFFGFLVLMAVYRMIENKYQN